MISVESHSSIEAVEAKRTSFANSLKTKPGYNAFNCFFYHRQLKDT